MAQGLAILAMVVLHLFCRRTTDLYNVHITIGDTPLLYYIGLFGDICVPIYCFVSGYAQMILCKKWKKNYFIESSKRIKKFILHFWLIVIVFSLIGIFVKNSIIPGSFMNFMGNMLLVQTSYNGAWWFVLTYIFLIGLCPMMETIIKKFNVFVVVVLSGWWYFFSYIFRFLYVLELENIVLAWSWRQILLIGTSQFAFVIGMIFYKYKVVEWLKEFLNRKKIFSILLVVFPLLMFGFHCKVQSLIIAPITGIVTVMCFTLWNKPLWVRHFFTFMGKHSMNIWLIHMFFYQVLFDGLVFKVQEPILIYLSTLGLSIIVSYCIDGIETVLMKRIYTSIEVCNGSKLN